MAFGGPRANRECADSPASAGRGCGIAKNDAALHESYLTTQRFSVNCVFRNGRYLTNRLGGSGKRFRRAPARGGVFLRTLFARPLRRAVASRYRGAPGRPRKVAPRSGTRSGPLRFARGFRRSEPPSAVASPTFLACTNGQAKKRLGNLFRLP